MARFGIGQPVTRREDQRLLTGAGRYTDDINIPGQAYAHILRSPHAHAEIAAIDTAAAAAAPGVACVLTGADIAADGLGDLPCIRAPKNRDGNTIHMPPYSALCRTEVRHVGDLVALVVADSPAQARNASELIEVDYRPLPAVTDTMGALAADAPEVWEGAPGNICIDWEEGDHAATDTAFERAEHVVSLDLVNNRLVGAPIEPRAAIGVFNAADESLTLHATTQGVHRLRDILADVIFHVPPEKVRITTPDVGGGFGIKAALYPEYALVLWASRKTCRAVKWTADRSQSFVGDIQGRDHVTRAELAFDDGGRIQGLRVNLVANLGAYLKETSPGMPTIIGAGMRSGAYAIPAGYVAVKGVFTHTTPVTAYRGVGAAEAIFMIERLIEAAAQELDLDPAEIRRRNLVPTDAMPYTNVFDMTFDSGDFAANMDEARAIAEWDGFPARCSAARARGTLRGIGMAYYVEASGGPGVGVESTAIRFTAENTIALAISGKDSGQGHETVFAQMAVERLGIPYDKIEVVQGDSNDLATGGLTADSRMMVVGGIAFKRTAEEVIAKGRDEAADLLEAAAADIEFADGAYHVAGTDRRMGLFEVAAAAREKSDEREGNPLDAFCEGLPEEASYPNGCHICEVEVDGQTGAVEIVAYTVVDDFGQVINPLLLAGQVHGGIAQGVGQALMENAVYEPDSGQLLTGSFMDYGMPRADTFPDIRSKWNEIPCRTNPLGVKGAGEGGTVGATPAVINAIVDALSDFGVVHIDTPATPERIWRAMSRQ